ncbi:MAG: hypothetical protein LBQ52_02830 [Helicobacteraceae bacterium]|nr:hypothetical protein [Helicobacteraceae bacterium]
MKEVKKRYVEVITSKGGKLRKFSNFAEQFLEEKLVEPKSNKKEFVKSKNDISQP